MRAAGLLVAVTLAAAGCGTGSGGGTTGPDRGGVAAGPAIAGPDRVVVAWCDRFAAKSPTTADGKVHVLTVAAFSVKDGVEVARQVATLPDGGNSTTLCDDYWTSAAGDRQVFNKDFTLVAGTVPAPGGKGRTATAFTLPGGRPVGLPATAAADDHNPVFQAGGSVLWYTTGDRHLAARDLGRPGTAPTEHGTVPGPDFALDGDRPWLRRPLDTKPDQVAIAPGGAVAAGTSSGGGVALWHRTDPGTSYADEYVEPPIIGESDNGRPVLPGSARVPWGAVRLWLDGQNLLLAANRNLFRVTLAADHSRVEAVQPLLPPDQLLPMDPVLAPDGRSLAFLARTTDGADLYRLDLVPGAAPARIGAVPAVGTATGPDATRPRLIAWQ